MQEARAGSEAVALQADITQKTKFSTDLQANVKAQQQSAGGEPQSVSHKINAHLTLQLVKKAKVSLSDKKIGAIASGTETLIARAKKSVRWGCFFLSSGRLDSLVVRPDRLLFRTMPSAKSWRASWKSASSSAAP
jgi:hypothetical protein